VNEAGGLISAYWIGAQISSFNAASPNGGAILNAGMILANDVISPTQSTGAAVWLKGNGRIENAARDTIGNGPFRIVTYDTVTIANAGTIGCKSAVRFNGQGRIDNLAGATIDGTSRGILLSGTTTVTNRGAISGGDFAVDTDKAGQGHRIVVYPGAVFAGTVRADKAGVATPSGVLELAAAGVGARCSG